MDNARAAPTPFVPTYTDYEVRGSTLFGREKEELSHSPPTLRRIGVRMLELGEDRSRVYRAAARLARGAQAKMVNLGANCCMSPDEDPLVNTRDIEPVEINLALEGDDHSLVCCTRQGDLLITREDCTTHLQPVLVHP